MDPFTIMAATGFAMQLGGIFGQSEAAQKSADAQKAIAGLQIQQDSVRRTAMEVSARRQQTENLRNTQLQRSMAMTAATSQGAQLGTGLQGGLAQVTNTGGWNALGINQSLYAGEKMFDLNDQVNQQKMNLSDAQSDQATAQGISSLGGSIMGASSGFGKLFGGGPSAGGFSQPQTYGQFVQSIGSNGIY